MDSILALPADGHSGSTVGLIPPGQWPLDDGGGYLPSTAQNIVYQQWDECWQKVRLLRKSKNLIVVHVGDAVDGIHHKNVQVVSPRVDEHERIHIACMNNALKTAKFGKKDKLFYIRGTEAHVGAGAESEESIAENMKAIPEFITEEERKSRYSHYKLSLRFGKHLVNIAHHGPNIGSRAWTKKNSLKNTIRSIYHQCLEDSVEIPRIWIWAHQHIFAHEVYEGSHGIIDGFILPGFQLKTGFINRVSKGAGLSDIGMLIIKDIQDTHVSYVCPRIQYEMTKVIRIE